MTHCAETNKAFADLGFIKEGRYWVHGRSDEDGRWARRLVLLYSEELDWEYLEEKTAPYHDEKEALAQLKAAANDD